MEQQFNKNFENDVFNNIEQTGESFKQQFKELMDVAQKRSEEHTSELQSHSFISYAVFCLKKKKTNNK